MGFTNCRIFVEWCGKIPQKLKNELLTRLFWAIFLRYSYYFIFAPFIQSLMKRSIFNR